MEAPASLASAELSAFSRRFTLSCTLTLTPTSLPFQAIAVQLAWETVAPVVAGDQGMDDAGLLMVEEGCLEVPTYSTVKYLLSASTGSVS